MLRDVLCCFTGEYHGKWVDLLPWAEYWYNTSYQTSAGMTPFQVVYVRSPPGILPHMETDDVPPLVSQWFANRDKLLSQIKSNLLRAQVRMKRFADLKRSEVQFQVGDWVFVKLQPYRQNSVLLHRNQKLGMKFFGPFQITQKVGKVAYSLNLPEGAKIHPVFHVALLKKCIGDPKLTTLPLPLMSSSQGPVIFPAKILQCRDVIRRGKQVTKVMIQWHRLTSDDTSWEDVDHLLQQYPGLDLEDKVIDYGRGIVTLPV